MKPPTSYYDPLFKLYCLAEKYEVTKLKEHLIDVLFERLSVSCAGISDKNISLVFEHTGRSSGMRRLILDSFAWDVKKEFFERQSVRDWLENEPEISLAFCLSFASRINVISPDSVSKSRDSASRHPIQDGSSSDYYDEPPKK